MNDEKQTMKVNEGEIIEVMKNSNENVTNKQNLLGI